MRLLPLPIAFRCSVATSPTQTTRMNPLAKVQSPSEASFPLLPLVPPYRREIPHRKSMTQDLGRRVGSLSHKPTEPLLPGHLAHLMSFPIISMRRRILD